MMATLVFRMLNPHWSGPPIPIKTSEEVDRCRAAGAIVIEALHAAKDFCVAGRTTREIDQAITEARSDAEHAVTEDRVPRRYHDSIKDYFQQLPDSPDQVRQAPAAPR